MRLMRLSKKIGKAKIIGNNSELDIGWASGPGFRDGPENYFCVKVETDDHNFALELNVDETRRLKEQVDKFLQHIDDGTYRWEPGNYFKNLKKNKRCQFL